MSEGNSYKIDDVFSITNGGNYENVGRIVYLETSTKNGEDTLYTKVYVDVFHWGNYEYNLENWGDGLIDYNGQRAAILVLSRPEIGTVEHGYSAIALGKLARATNIAAFAEGRETWAYGQGSHTEGIGTTASFASHAEGHYSHATGHYSHAEGERTESIGARSHAEGWHTIAKGMGAHAEGGITNVDYNYDPTLVNTALGDFSHVEGSRTTTNGDYSHAEGYQTFTQRTAAHAEGYDTKAIGAYSHAEGHTTTANG